MLTFTDGTTRGEYFFAEDIDLALPRPRYEVSVRLTEVIVTAAVLLRDLALFPDRVSPLSTVDKMLVTLLPGESATFHVRGLDAHGSYAEPPILRCANDLSS